MRLVGTDSRTDEYVMISNGQYVARFVRMVAAVAVLDQCGSDLGGLRAPKSNRDITTRRPIGTGAANGNVRRLCVWCTSTTLPVARGVALISAAHGVPHMLISACAPLCTCR